MTQSDQSNNPRLSRPLEDSALGQSFPLSPEHLDGSPVHMTHDLDQSETSGDTRPEMPEAPEVRILVVVDYYGDGTCVAEAISRHRACSVAVESFSGGPTGALRALADQIDAAEDHYRGVPD